MGIPSNEITLRVHEAMTLIMHKMGTIRWQAEVSKKHEAHLIEALDLHELLPVVSHHAFDQYLIHAAEHIARTKEPSFLLFIKSVAWMIYGNVKALVCEMFILFMRRALSEVVSMK